jgi:hypothetical protein
MTLRYEWGEIPEGPSPTVSVVGGGVNRVGGGGRIEWEREVLEWVGGL